MHKILIFAGTTEGRALAEFCAENELDETALTEKLKAAGFRYDESQRRFR
jgi:precorrin-6x reductase